MKTKKEKKAKIRLIQRVSEAMKKGGIPNNVDRFSDNSASWIEIKNKDFSFTIQFDGKGEEINRIGCWQDIIEVVDQKAISIINGN